jgi:AcrR family transcriptional regulator
VLKAKEKPKEKILAAADQIFGEVGFDAATTREIAERSGVNKALIHYHFKSKEGLLEALLDGYYEKLGETLRAALLGDGDLRSRLLELVDAYLSFLRQNRNFGRMVQREASGGRHMDRISSHMVPLFELGTHMLKELFPGSRTGALAAEQMLVSFYGIIITYFTYSGVIEHLLGSDPMADGPFEARRAHVRRMVDIVLAAVEAEPAPTEERP